MANHNVLSHFLSTPSLCFVHLRQPPALLFTDCPSVVVVLVSGASKFHSQSYFKSDTSKGSIVAKLRATNISSDHAPIHQKSVEVYLSIKENL